ncbi:uncharacterized protein UV8b_07649 [Ustilaginoidea virens]|uniref:Biogenesis of lysosome-related organelles complex 1 subunit 5 n=1 Tax=Ustilaginoidea virens TaxID=1159556 RepID=A0A8E5HY25_USTVR|nr:uncharacterized protein UV8b_07649 [Ustilaginoidea virens]QUC23408.1 hypothetical protein UV8b_07649 [Ustilaginoidea virens]
MSAIRDPSPKALSSSTAAEKSTSLRARLRSEDLVHHHHAAGPRADGQSRRDIYRQLQANFSAVLQAEPSRPGSTNAQMAHIAESFARYGQDVYNTAVEAVQSAHKATSSEIAGFQARVSSTLGRAHALYDNIVYPLSATVCHSESLPRASIAKHIRTLQKRLSAAEDELEKLNEEWKACIAEEVRILTCKRNDGDDQAECLKEKYMREVDDIVAKKTSEINELDREYRDLLWAESKKMMQAMMAD